MNYILELNVEITIDKNNPSYILHHIEPIVCEEKPSNKEISEMIKNERNFVEGLLGFKPYCVAINAGTVGTKFFSE